MKHIQTYQKKIINLKCVFPQFCLERKNYCLFVKIQGHCPKLFFINEFLFLINCSQTHIPASLCSLAFTVSQCLSHCHSAAAAPAGWAVPAGHRGPCWLLLCPCSAPFRCRRGGGCTFPGTEGEHALLQLKFATPFCFSHQFRQADFGHHALDTRFVAHEAVTQTKLNICWISFYTGWILTEIRFFKGHWGCRTFKKLVFSML